MARRKQPKVYFSHWTAIGGPGYQRFDRDYPVSWEHWREWMHACHRGEARLQEDFPNPIWTNELEPNKQPSDATRASDVPVVSERFREVLEHFDLGGSVFYPVTVLKKNRKDAYDGKYFYFNIRSLKNALKVEESVAATLKATKKTVMIPKVFRYLKDGKEYSYQDAPAGSLLHMTEYRSDAKLVLSEGALDGADLWFEKRLHNQAVFFSEPLRDAIKAANIRPMTTYRVKVLP